MRLLLDTISRELITHQASGVFLSHVSLWEIATKARPDSQRHAALGRPGDPIC